MKKKILFWSMFILSMAFIVIAPDLSPYPKLEGLDKTECQLIREEYYAFYEGRNMQFTAKDQKILIGLRDKYAAKLGIANPDDYVFDFWSCTFFTKEETRQGKILEYRKQLGLK